MNNLETFFESIYNESHFNEESADQYFSFLKNVFEDPKKRIEYLRGDGKRVPKTYVDTDRNLENYEKRGIERFIDQLSRNDINAKDYYFEGDDLETFKTDFEQYLNNCENQKVASLFKNVIKKFFDSYCKLIDIKEKEHKVYYHGKS